MQRLDDSSARCPPRAAPPARPGARRAVRAVDDSPCWLVRLVPWGARRYEQRSGQAGHLPTPTFQRPLRGAKRMSQPSMNISAKAPTLGGLELPRQLEAFVVWVKSYDGTEALWALCLVVLGFLIGRLLAAIVLRAVSHAVERTE